MGIDLGNLAALRTFRVLRALKTVAIIPGKYIFNRGTYLHPRMEVPLIFKYPFLFDRKKCWPALGVVTLRHREL